VATADVHHQAVVDVDPHVVIAAELEILARNVLELRRNLHREAVIVAAATHVPVELRIFHRLCIV
jgi:hypothetical protein